MRDRILAGGLTGRKTLVGQIALIIGASALIALAAQVSVPFYPVPMTLQTLAVLIVGFGLGARLGALALIAYLAEGALGLPVFANAGASASLIGPMAGFLFGFVAMAWLAGLAAERGLARGFVTTALVALALSALLYLPGLAWLSSFIGIDKAIALGALPFLLGDALKAVIAAMVVSGGRKALAARRQA